MSTALLDPKNDYVFKRLFAEAPDLLLALINDLRPDLPPITSVEVLNPNIEAGELSGKYIILDVLARDADGHQYNVEMQVRRYEDARMATISHKPIKQAVNRIRQLSADEEDRKSVV